MMPGHAWWCLFSAVNTWHETNVLAACVCESVYACLERVFDADSKGWGYGVSKQNIAQDLNFQAKSLEK